MATYDTHVRCMICVTCERVISFALRQIPGVQGVRARYLTSSVSVDYDPRRCDTATIDRTLAEIGYPAGKGPGSKLTKALLLGAALLLFLLLQVAHFPAVPQTDEATTLPFLFVVGAVTSLHCVAMCGGIMLSQTLRPLERSAERLYGSPSLSTFRMDDLRPALAYNLGRLCSYTLVGAVLGALGAPLVYNDAVKGCILILAGALVLVMGLKMVGVVPSPQEFVARMRAMNRRERGPRRRRAPKSPLIIGLATGMLPCGALASMWAYAASTGSVVEGALSMAVFALGTIPLMLLFGGLGATVPASKLKALLVAGAVFMTAFGLCLGFAGAKALL